ncbi:contractile injection system protein, VgrG/Pvc8 family [Photobacterium atrarenae]|uniref:Contractile injection system protein, VgrG/Pvc8 family n=1 Tax=Photobacterium atrarenae TaxID=865757 RepID=A0ABY5GB48_9GAMM|nr:contractile injection system protein, VgrG/Pvc8 family [Photobacterium atrarenae]UTV26372.1 contractile injection system protein, VgrG/Pvc8 family [Photobacterium atrarenae]
MGLDHRPDFSLSADGNDITAVIQRNLISLTLTDNAGSESDRLAIAVILPDTVATPKKGAVLRLGLGFNGELTDKGQFVVDEVTSSGPPRVVQIVANAAPMDNRKQPGSLQTQKTRSFDDLTLGDLVKSVASEHGLVPRISSELDSIKLTHVDQVSESDMNLLTRLAKRYGAVSKPANGYWLFLKEGEGKSASGKALTSITLQPHQVTTWQCRFSSRNDVRRVVATYHDLESGDTKEVSTGTGEPEFRIVFKYPNYEEAKAAVLARAKQVKSGSDTLDITLPARSSLMALVAEGHVTLDGFGDLEDGKWRLKTVEWSLSDSGLQLRLSGDHGAD